jgi:hypothetical protein
MTIFDSIPVDFEIIIHGGLSKTGSSAIQNFLEVNREELLAQKIYYPPRESVGHSGNFDPLIVTNEPILDSNFFLTYLIKDVQDAIALRANKLIYSSENFCSITKVNLDYFLQNIIKFGIYITVLIIKRDPYDWVFSSWVQQTKEGVCKAWVQDALINPDYSLHPLRTAAFIRMFYPNIDLQEIEYEDYSEDIVAALCKFINFINPTNSRVIFKNISIGGFELLIYHLANNLPPYLRHIIEETIEHFRRSHQYSGSLKLIDRTVLDVVNNYCLENGLKISRHTNVNAIDFSLDFLIGTLSSEQYLSYQHVLNFSTQWSKIQSDRVAYAIQLSNSFKKSNFCNKCPTDFDPVTYYLLNEDVALSGSNPYEHYYLFGVKERRNYSVRDLTDSISGKS